MVTNAGPETKSHSGRIPDGPAGTGRVVLAYAAFAGLWILFSDRAVEAIAGDLAEHAMAQTFKGLAFVGVTSLLLYALVRRLLERVVAATVREREAIEASSRALHLLDAIAEGSTDAIFAKDLEGRYLLCNRAASGFIARPREEVIGKQDAEIFPPVQAALIRANDARVKAEDRVVTFEEELTTDRGRVVFLATKGPLRDADGRVVGIYGVSRDITELKRAEAKLRQANRALRTLTECNQAIVRATSEAVLLREICRHVIEFGGYRMAWVGYAMDDGARTVRPVAQAGFDPDYLDATRISWADEEHGRGPTGTAIRERRVVIARNIAGEPGFAAWRAAAIRHGYASSIALPLIGDGDECMGALNLYSQRGDAFDADETQLLVELASDLAYGVRALRDRDARRRAEGLLNEMSAIADLGGWELDAWTGRVSCSREAYRIYGISQEDFPHTMDAFIARVHPDDRGSLLDWTRRRRAGEEAGDAEFRVIHARGEVRMLVARAVLERDAVGSPVRLVGSVQDITSRKRAEQLLAIQNRLLEGVAAGRPLEESLGDLAHAIEDLAPGMLASVLLLDDDGVHLRHAAAPSLPEEFIRAVDGRPVGARAGSFGTAAWRREPVIVEDIAEDDLWADYRNVALACGLRACWSTPILGHDGRVLGTFALYYRSLARPTEHHLHLISLATHVAAVAIARHRAETALRDSEDLYRSLFDNSIDAVLLTAPDGTIFAANPAAQRVFGRTEEELRAAGREALVDASDPRLAAALAELERTGRFSGELHLQRRDGTTFPAEVSSLVFADRDGRPRTSMIVRDIAAQRAAEAQLRKLSLAVEQSPESIVITNLEAEIEYVNDAFLRITGYSREEVMGRNPRILHSGKTPREIYEAMWSALARGEPWKGEFNNRRKDGSEYVEFAIITPIRQTDGRITHYVAVKEDITEKKRMAEELDRHRHHLEELVAAQDRRRPRRRAPQADAANRAKSAFLANMSHEIRTPMNAIVGLTHLLQRAGVTPSRPSGWTRSTRPGSHLLPIINDILDLSKIEAGQLDLEQHRLPPRRGARQRPLADRRPGRRPRDSRVTVEARRPCPRGCAATRPGCARPCSTTPATRSSSPSAAPSRCARRLLEEAGDEAAACASRCATPASASPPTSCPGCSRPSSRPTPPPPASTAAPAWAWPSPGGWPS